MHPERHSVIKGWIEYTVFMYTGFILLCHRFLNSILRLVVNSFDSIIKLTVRQKLRTSFVLIFIVTVLKSLYYGCLSYTELNQQHAV